MGSLPYTRDGLLGFRLFQQLLAQSRQIVFHLFGHFQVMELTLQTGFIATQVFSRSFASSFSTSLATSRSWNSRSRRVLSRRNSALAAILASISDTRSSIRV